MSDEFTLESLSSVGLIDLEDLLDSFASIKPVVTQVSAGILENRGKLGDAGAPDLEFLHE